MKEKKNNCHVIKIISHYSFINSLASDNSWSPRPIATICTRCSALVITLTEVRRSTITHLSAFLLCLCGLVNKNEKCYLLFNIFFFSVYILINLLSRKSKYNKLNIYIYI